MPVGPRKPKDASSHADDQDFVTSEDLFGDMVDAPLPTSEGSPADKRPVRTSPIKVQVSEPGLPSDSRPRPIQGAALPPEEMDALLDRISALTPTLARKTDPAGEDVDELLSRLAPLGDEQPGDGETPPPSGIEPSLLSGEAGEFLDGLDVPPPASRTGTKFQIADAPAKEESLPGLDLAGLAENAFEEKTPPKATEGARGRTHWRDDNYGPYRLIDRLAVGGMAEVFKAKRSGVEGFE
ncbi:MAG TPA: hypothetical protein VIC87_05635, partial [Vicinamibacteria bacterium]